MKYKVLIGLICAVAVAGLSASCIRFNVSESCQSLATLRGDGNVQLYRVEISDYNQLSLAGGNVYYVPGQTFLEIETDSNAISRIVVEEQDGLLAIYPKDVSPTKLVIKTGSPSLKKMDASGACKVVVSNTLHASRLDVNLAGASQLRTVKPLLVDTLTIDVSGASKIVFGDTVWVSQIDMNLVGSSKLRTDKLMLADTLNVVTAGASNVELIGRVRNGFVDGVGASKFDLAQCAFSKLVCEAAGSSTIILGLVDELSYNLTGASRLSHKKSTKVLDASISGASTVSKK